MSLPLHGFNEHSTRSFPTLTETHRLVLADGPILAPHVFRKSLSSGNSLQGPAVIIQEDTTIVLGMNDRAQVDDYANLIISIEHEAS